jgi:hypothetical protein
MAETFIERSSEKGWSGPSAIGTGGLGVASAVRPTGPAAGRRQRKSTERARYIVKLTGACDRSLAPKD